jgi:glutaminase
MVSVKLGNGARLASLVPGVAFGEMALIEGSRLADVWADSPVRCLEFPVGRLEAFRDRHPRASERIVRNLAVLLARRLAVANSRIELLSGR